MTASLVHSAGLVLRNLRFGETSRVASLFTRELGKIGIIAKGARDPKSPFGASLEILSHSSFVIYYRRGRDLQFLQSGSLEHEYRGVLRSPQRYLWACAWVEFFDRVLLEDEPAGDLFALALRGMEVLEAAPLASLPELFRGLQLRATSTLGYTPSLEQCLRCQKVVPGPESKDDRPWCFLPAQGGVLCPDCAPRGEGGGILLSSRALRRVRAMARGASPAVGPVSGPIPATGFVREATAMAVPSPVWLLTLDRLVEEFLRFHVESYRGLRSLEGVASWKVPEAHPIPAADPPARDSGPGREALGPKKT